MITARSQYDDRPVLASDLSFQGDKGVTKQSDAKDCDINLLFKRFERSGQLPDMILREPRYGDFSAVPDYQEACNIVKLASEQFNNLDVAIRNRFANDPVKFLEFVNDEKNIDEIDRMGLLTPEASKARLDKKVAQQKADEAEKKPSVTPDKA